MEVPVIPLVGDDPRAFSVHIDTLGQLPMLNIYTQISLVYPISDASLHSSIIEKLTEGLERLSTSFPWTAGQVLPEKDGDGQAVSFSIQPFEKTSLFVVRDLRNDPSANTIDDLRKAKFPFRMFDENVVAPRMTFPKTDTEGTAFPVFAVQANFIKGGLILTFAGQHQTMDMIGLYQCMSLLSKTCHPGYKFTSEEISIGNMERKRLIPLIEDESYKSDPQLARQIVKPVTQPTESSTAYPAPPKCVWKYFSFSAKSLSSLKALATETMPKDAAFVSTDDTLSAFIWRAIIRARAPRIIDPSSTEATFARAVDVRRYLSIPAEYPGTIQNMSYVSLPVSSLVDDGSTLGSIASQMRTLVDPETHPWHNTLELFVTFLEHSVDKAAAYVTATLNLDVDLMFSSWAKIKCYDLDFNLGLGKPEAVRRPLFEAVESLLYLMPKRGDGEIALAVALREDDMERLKNDEEFGKYAIYID